MQRLVSIPKRNLKSLIASLIAILLSITVLTALAAGLHKHFTTIQKPKMFISPKNFETNIYQGSYAKFGIVIENSGQVPLKNVKLYPKPAVFIKPRSSTPKPIKAYLGVHKWFSFDKNNFDIPAGGKVIVNYMIKVPKDAKEGKYIGIIAVDADNGLEIINLTVNVQRI